MKERIQQLEGAITDAIYLLESEGDPIAAHRKLCEVIKHGKSKQKIL